MKNKVLIPEPCFEDWNQMTPNGPGRHCDVCCKTVVDFTSWKTEDILVYLQSKKEERVCGRYLAEQVEKPEHYYTESLSQKIISANINIFKKIAALIILVFGLSGNIKAQKLPVIQGGLTKVERGNLVVGPHILFQFSLMDWMTSRQSDTTFMQRLSIISVIKNEKNSFLNELITLAETTEANKFLIQELTSFRSATDKDTALLLNLLKPTEALSTYRNKDYKTKKSSNNSFKHDSIDKLFTLILSNLEEIVNTKQDNE